MRITGVPASLSSFKLQQMLPQFRISRVELSAGSSKDVNDAIVVVSSLKEVENLVNTVNIQNPGNFNLVAEACPQFDTGLEFVFPENEVPSADTIVSALRNASVDFKSMSMDSNISAFVAFENIEQARQCQRAFRNREVEGSESWSGQRSEGSGLTYTSMSEYPSYAIEVVGVSSDESAEPVLEAIKDVAEVVRADRMGSVKFKKHAHVSIHIFTSNIVNWKHAVGCSWYEAASSNRDWRCEAEAF